jgi:CBS domain-containing protein
MLRITVHSEPGSLTFQLEGSLVGPWVRELEACWQTTVTGRRVQPLLLDLTGVTYVDAAGEACLAALHRQGAEFVAADCLMKAVVAEITGRPYRTVTRTDTMVATTGPLFALTASDLMSRDVVTISQDTPPRAAAELFFQQQVEEAAVVDADRRCVGMLSATDLLRWALQAARGAEDASPPACPYQVKGRLLTGPDAVVCTLAPGNCPLQEPRALTGGRHTAVCQLVGVVSDWQQVSGRVRASAVRRYMTADSTVGADAPLSALARAVVDGHVHRLIVVDEQHRPIGTVSCLDVLDALARRRADRAGG